ncbi:MAG TPA: type II 3-dehydroquinate dehydratase [Gammaproteobacteria bacterium]|nr:type II 3-dehydroquinate dehydratase [Gammaproteobacteria bacterium]
MARFLLLNGPNLDLLGEREPEIYGRITLRDIESRLVAQAEALGHQMICFQANAEHALIERVHAARNEDIAWILINPAAFTHTSVALRDALAAVAIPFTEVHLSNVHRREPFRRHSYFSDLAEGVISGLGIEGYEAALRHAHARLSAPRS